MISTHALTDDLLTELEACWRAQGAEIVDQLRPAEEIDAVLEPVGLTLPAEARIWWGWHDGSELDRASRRAP